MSTTRIAGMLRVLSLFLLIALATHAQATTYDFKTLYPPGATNSTANSINASGQVAGSYSDASGVYHGFVYSEGKFTSLDVPGAQSTGAASINASGQVVGKYSDASGAYHGFVYSEGKFTSLYPPGATNSTANSINASGQVAGSYSDASGVYHGFVYSEGKFTSLNVPGAQSTGAASINASGQVVGYYSNPFAPIFGFVYSEGKFTFLNAGRGTSPTSINDSGQVVGNFIGSLGNPGTYGFMYSGGEYTVLNFPVPGPGTKNTGARSINASGQVVGYYSDNLLSVRGFVYSEGKYTSLDVPGATTTIANSINDRGQVVGDYYDASYASHGFIATPITLFSTFNVTRLVIDQNRGALFLGSNFTLGKGSNGINPVREEVTLKIANATLTIPAGSFHKNSHPSFFAFAGQIDNVWIESLIKPLGRNRFAFQALAYGAPLGDTKNPVMVELTIGDDRGATTAQARTH